MSVRPPLFVFSDLDGTLLSHETYAWDAARPALRALAQIGAGVVLASSKTAPEVGPLRHAMGLADWPAIVENGSGVLEPGSAVENQSGEYDRILTALGQIDPALRAEFRGFDDMDIAEVVSVTGLTFADAKLSKTRSFSEPGLWSGTASQRQKFIDVLRLHGISAREGGRFLTLSFGRTKADRMATIIEKYNPRHTMALGDAPNDVEMLEAADIGVIVGNPHRAPLPLLSGERNGTITRTKATGPEGWNAAVLNLIHDLRLS